MNKYSAGGSAAKSVAIAILVLLLAASTFLGWASGGFKNWDTATWFEKTETSVSDTGGELVVEETVAAPAAAMTFAARAAETGKNDPYPLAQKTTVTATVYPDNDAADTALTWSAAWEDGESEWASGKDVNEYIYLYSAEGVAESKTVTVYCLRAFGETVILTAKKADGLTGETRVDYCPVLTGAAASLGSIPLNMGGETGVNVSMTTTSENGGRVSVTPKTTSLYSKTDDYTWTATLIAPRSGNKLTTSGGTPMQWDYRTNDVDLTNREFYLNANIFLDFDFKFNDPYQNKWISWNERGIDMMRTYFSNINRENGDGELWDIRIDIEGRHSSTTVYTSLIVTGTIH